ncbi:hypothetical protein Tco_1269424 [Tanacetum coccineum]
MNRSLFTRIVRDLSANCPYFQEGCDAVGKASISALVKCTSAICQLAYAAVPDSLDEYLQIDEKTSRDCLMHFCNGVIELYGEGENCEGLRKLTSKNSMLFMRTNMGFLLGSNDVKRIRYKQAHKAGRKDAERAFGVLKKKIGYQKGKAISPDFYPEEQHREDDPAEVEAELAEAVYKCFGRAKNDGIVSNPTNNERPIFRSNGRQRWQSCRRWYSSDSGGVKKDLIHPNEAVYNPFFNFTLYYGESSFRTVAATVLATVLQYH